MSQGNLQDNLQFVSPPVVQHASRDGFTVSIEVNQRCTGHVEWGWSADELTNRAVAAPYGLVVDSDRCLMIPVVFPKAAPAGQPVFYRVVAQSLQYVSVYNISRGSPVETEVRQLQLPHADQETATIAIVNDTHGNESTVTALAKRVHELAPDLLVWNGDACEHFTERDQPARLLLRPGANAVSASAGGWASTHPLLFVCGNHDIRGAEARQLSAILAPGPHPHLPWNTARRIGPLALIALDTGEDKPDHHPVFAGTAAYEPYRERQATWLATQLARPEITQAPFKVAITHIPLRGLPGQNDGTTLEGAAAFSGQGAGLWLPQLIRAGFQAILSGHTHEWRVDPPTTAEPITQFVGGGPKPDKATIMVMEVHPDRLTTRMEHLKGDVLATETWSR